MHAHRLGRLTEHGVHEHFLRNLLSALVMRAPIGTAHPVANTHTHHSTHTLWFRMTTTRQTVSARADACKHVMSLVGIPPDDHIFIISQDNGVLSAGLGFLTRADKAMSRLLIVSLFFSKI